ncbi:Sequence-specific DNA binding transcription factors DNA binding DNA binding isoform 1 [Tripterygium wilfordii]|uniref:Sequence-specific DNA binding transcription factors DNA binding DNA binding isoform 1 n=1 Tax=Tripterygium wilfordii TaxID=458696 RepID=A0A7J7CMV4_TRIWF|nr:SWR1 complex subunit 2 [Tripterygium wilfordii]KAF5735417.1 Sequence-specific DNA binding transcription factors DNA binding DNA binding isoform 1 [Tripterygium wilfordii]
MESSNDDARQEFLDRGSRATRGKRMNKLLDEEIEQDEVFWNQEALKEEENDDNYEEEPEVADEFDSDFDEDEPDPDEGGENEAEERTEKKKRLIPPGRPSTKKKKKKKVLSGLEKSSKDEKSSPQSTDTPEHQDAPGSAEVERTIRKSTRTAVIVRQAERDAIRAALQATAKPIKRKKEGEEKRMTQEEMLLEAAQTEIMNLRNLERVLAREEEVKKRAIVHKAVYSDPQIHYISKNGCTYIEFSKGASFESEISTAPIPYKEKAVCAVTGMPAKYRDPKTGLPYASKEAFRVIRERFVDDNGSIKKEMDMGNLFDSLSGNGFLARRKRTINANRSMMPRFQNFAIFPRTPASEDDDSE